MNSDIQAKHALYFAKFFDISNWISYQAVDRVSFKINIFQDNLLTRSLLLKSSYL